MHISTSLRVFPLILGIALLGCGDDGPSGPAQGGCGLVGTSNATVGGNVTGSLKCASYAVSTGITPAFVLSLTTTSTANPPYGLSFGREGTRPGTGTFNVAGAGESDWNGWFVYANDRYFELTGGTVTVTTSNAGNLSGNLNVTGVEANGSEMTVTITGSFAANCVDTNSTDC